jgi:hypothetical protein
MSSTDFLTYLNSSVSAFRKTVYLDELAAYPYMMQAPVFSLIPHNQNYISDITKWKIDMGTADGISMSSISLNSPVIEAAEAQVQMYKMFQTLEFDRFSMKIMQDPKASAIDLAKKAIEKASLERAMTLEGIIVGSDGTGSIGVISAVTDNGSGSYTCTLTTASWAWGNWRRRLMVVVGATTDIFDVEDVDDVNHTVTIVRRSGGTKVPVAPDNIYRQNASSNYPGGLKYIIEGTSTLYGVTRQHGWQSLKVDWTNISITEQRLLELYMKIYQRSGEYPDMLLLSPNQYLRVQQLVRDRSIFTADAFVKRTGSDGKDLSYNVPDVCYINLGGHPVKLVSHAHMAPGSGYFFNTEHLELCSVGSGDFVSPLGNSTDYMQYMGNITGNDRYRMLWAYYFAIRTDRPESHGGFIKATSTTADSLF